MSIRTQSFRRRLVALNRRNILLGLGLAIAMLAAVNVFAPVASVNAADGLLDQARAAGIVGERFDGYAMIRDAGASSALRQLVNDVNARRKQVYENRAASEGIPVAQVGRVYAQEISESAPPGTWYLSESGAWAQH